MYKVKLHANWDPNKVDTDYLENIDIWTRWCYNHWYILENNYIWNDCFELVSGDEYDFVVIFNIPRKGFKFDKKKAIIVYTEPKVIIKSWVKLYLDDYYVDPPESDFFRIYSIDKFHNFTCFWTRFYDPLNLDKTQGDTLSFMISRKNFLEGHKDRLNFINNYLYKYDNSIRFFTNEYIEYYNQIKEEGKFKNIKLVENQTEAILHYKYMFQSENCYENNYMTEKIIAPIYTNTLVFWSGTETIFNHISPIFYVYLDIKNNPQESYEIIKRSIQDKEWEKRIDRISKEKVHIHNKFNVLRVIEGIIKGYI